jgi:hypothetical protein
MAARRDFTIEAEALFHEIVAATGLTYQQDHEWPELIWKLPIQHGLSVPMMLGLQNDDELNLGIGDFWSYIFPFPKVQHDFRRLAIGFVEGRCRVSEWRRMGVLYKRTLEEPDGLQWRRAYTEHLFPLPLPFGARQRTYIVNSNAAT